MDICPVCNIGAFVRQGNCFVCQVCGFSYCDAGLNFSGENVNPFDLEVNLAKGADSVQGTGRTEEATSN